MLLRSLMVLMLAGFLAACNDGKPSFKNTDITGADYAKGFSLTDHTGKARTPVHSAPATHSRTLEIGAWIF